MIQKVALACSLCLTVVVVVFTVTRASGLEWKGNLDVLWEVYFQIVATEVGLILVAMTAFRQLFVSRTGKNQHQRRKSPSLWLRSRTAWRKLLDPRRWTSGYSKKSEGREKKNSEKSGSPFDEKLPGIPGGTMTGVQTFINHHGGLVESSDESSVYSTNTDADRDTRSLTEHTEAPCGQGRNTMSDQLSQQRGNGARPVQSTENDTLTSVIGMYQDRSQRG